MPGCSAPTSASTTSSGIFVASGCAVGFARGGTTLGGASSPAPEPTRSVLRHEAVHADQWARYGIVFGLLYLREELRHRGPRNRFEIEAGLEDGGYRGELTGDVRGGRALDRAGRRRWSTCTSDAPAAKRPPDRRSGRRGVPRLFGQHPVGTGHLPRIRRRRALRRGRRRRLAASAGPAIVGRNWSPWTRTEVA